jgi:hypothetical protein
MGELAELLNQRGGITKSATATSGTWHALPHGLQYSLRITLGLGILQGHLSYQRW